MKSLLKALLASAMLLLFISVAVAGNYTKIANDGSFLPLTTMQGSGLNDWGCTQDNETGLVWEVKKSDSDLRDKDSTYSWYNTDPNTNGGNAGTQNGGSCSGSACDTEDFVSAVNSDGLCSGSDWYLPTIEELKDLVFCSNGAVPNSGDSCGTSGTYTSPTIEASFFPNAVQSHYWSASTPALLGGFAWGVNFNIGSDSIQGKGSESYGAVRLVRGAQPVNEAPTLSVIGSQTINADTQAEISFTVGDAETALESLVVTASSSNTLLIPNEGISFSGSGSSRTIIVTPASGESGEATISILLNDGVRSESVSQSFSITVNAIPVATSASVTTTEDHDASGTLQGSDLDGDSLSYSIVTPPQHGAVTLEGGNGPAYSYSPDDNYHGTDSFSYRVHDGAADSNTATISLTIDSINDVPLSFDSSDTADEDSDASGTLQGSDIDGDSLSYSIVTPPQHGAVTLEGGNGPAYSYSPDDNYHGTDSFSYRVHDGAADSNTATISLTINSINDVPLAFDSSNTADEDSDASGTLQGSDIDGDSLSYSIVTPPQHGVVILEGGSGATYNYSPAANYHGTDSFSYKTNDGNADSSTATISLTINSINDAPVISLIHDLSIDQDTSTPAIAFTVDDVDGFGIESTLTVDATSSNIELVSRNQMALQGEGSDYTLVITPASHQYGASTITLAVSDGVESSHVSFVLTVRFVNSAPTVSGVPATSALVVGDSFSFVPRIEDRDGDPLSIAVDNLPQWLTLNSITGEMSGTPTQLDVGRYSHISLVVSDGVENAYLAPFLIDVFDVEQLSTTLNSAINSPAELSLSSNSGNSISLIWDSPEPEVSALGYRIDRLSKSGDIDETFYTKPDETTYTDHGLVPMTTYDYRVSVFDSQGASLPARLSGTTTALISDEIIRSTLQLQGGWNLIHLPQQTAVSEIKQKIPQLHSVWGFKNCSKKWEYALFDVVDGSSVAGSEITLLEPGRGYWVYLAGVDKKEQIRAEVEGKALTSPIIVESARLYPGWNSIGITESIILNETALPEQTDTVWGWDGYWVSYSSEIPLFLNTLQQLEVSRGYFVNQGQSSQDSHATCSGVS
ncbi:MAG TPA: tandem-95 repeat protein [Gammaproteobacteria bacterium]|nr:tandem-95 repeat protein [Gammaproteobacteria bacterium]